MIQVHYFQKGGFVVHKAIDGKTSAWFSADGKLLDCEYRDSAGRYRSVLGRDRRAKLESIGRIYRRA